MLRSTGWTGLPPSTLTQCLPVWCTWAADMDHPALFLQGAKLPALHKLGLLPCPNML